MAGRNPQVELLLRLLDDGFNRPAWHGPNLRGSLRRVDEALAVWRAGANRRCIAEIAVHAAYWKYAARRRILGEKRGSFPLKGSNWFPIGDALTREQWRSRLAMLDEQHGALREAVAGLADKNLAVVPKGARVDNGSLLYGIAHHDVYHAGQIQFIKRLYGA